MNPNYKKCFTAAALLLIGGKLIKTMQARRRAGTVAGEAPHCDLPPRRTVSQPRQPAGDRGAAYDPVAEASMESFPASDSPAFTPGVT